MQLQVGFSMDHRHPQIEFDLEVVGDDELPDAVIEALASLLLSLWNDDCQPGKSCGSRSDL
jgi:hypothetical protein